MDKKIINTLVGICENNENYSLVYTPAYDKIALSYTDSMDEILSVEKIIDKEYEFNSIRGENFTDRDIDFIISAIYNSLIVSKFESLFEDLNINNIEDFNKVIERIDDIR